MAYKPGKFLHEAAFQNSSCGQDARAVVKEILTHILQNQIVTGNYV